MSDPSGPAAVPTHPAIDDDAVARLRARAGAPPATAESGASPGPGSVSVPGSAPDGAPLPAGRAAAWKARARQAATPVVARVRNELDRATSGEVALLRAEVAELRAELARMRAEHQATLAVLREDRRVDRG
jgi:hypothetical protein